MNSILKAPQIAGPTTRPKYDDDEEEEDEEEDEEEEE